MSRDRTSSSHKKPNALCKSAKHIDFKEKNYTTKYVRSGQNKEYKPSAFPLLQCFIIFEATVLALKGTYFRKVKKFKQTW